METNRTKYYSDLSTKHAAWLKSFPSVVIENGHVRRWQEKLLPSGNPRDRGEVLQDFRGHREGKGVHRGVFCLHGSNVRSDQLFESENVKRRYAYKLVQRSPALIDLVITGPVHHRRPPRHRLWGLKSHTAWNTVWSYKHEVCHDSRCNIWLFFSVMRQMLHLQKL